jgi:hypothetical protein
MVKPDEGITEATIAGCSIKPWTNTPHGPAIRRSQFFIALARLRTATSLPFIDRLSSQWLSAL